jgi:hypothetical protein
VIEEVNAKYPELLTAPLNKFKQEEEEASTVQASP